MGDNKKMKTSKLILIIIIVNILIFTNINAQEVLGTEGKPNAHPWKKEKTENRLPVPYQYVRESDVFWSKTIWRIMDLREKINLPFYYPERPTRGRKSLAQILWDAVTVEGVLNAYDGEEFALIVPPEQIIASNTKSDSIVVPKISNPDEDSVVYSVSEFSAKDVKKFLIREDWFFDKQRSVMEVRIIGLCMIKDEYTIDPNTGEEEYKGMKQLFWVHFPEARKILAKYEVFNRWNDAERMSYDDVFFKRFFGSYIVKEENVYDRDINEYESGLGALLEAEKIKDKIMEFEMDLWEY